MKKALLTIGQFLLFLVVFAAGSFLHPLNFHWAQKTTAAGVTSVFIADGLLLATGLFVAIVAVQALLKRRCDTPWTVVGFLLAVGVGYAIRLGFITRDF
ncbi:MAG: hypothetical protein PW789_07905 [Edaphobacter sp.]|uniref:hypothetical protein n=1 Tax=Edaphobacter sp. TaxID=1934404 RepID=UPI00239116F1|nr:hypothetical protein [Edaphobacter sp.]MDE1176517.1 hypothetical protein [Edaphobacter sp.]